MAGTFTTVLLARNDRPLPPLPGPRPLPPPLPVVLGLFTFVGRPLGRLASTTGSLSLPSSSTWKMDFAVATAANSVGVSRNTSSNVSGPCPLPPGALPVIIVVALPVIIVVIGGAVFCLGGRPLGRLAGCGGGGGSSASSRSRWRPEAMYACVGVM